MFDDEINSFTTNLDFIAYQEHVITNVKDPFSIALGMQFKTRNKKNAIMLTTEYFFPIDAYSPLETRNTATGGNIQVHDIPKAMTFMTSATGVLNVAVGFIQYFSEKFTVAGGFKTDFNNLSTLDKYEERSEYLASKMRNLYIDKYHVIVGPSFQIKSFGVILGIQYTWGRQKDIYNIASFIDPIEYIQETNLSLQGTRQNNMTLSYNEVSFFFGLTYGFGRWAIWQKLACKELTYSK